MAEIADAKTAVTRVANNLNQLADDKVTTGAGTSEAYLEMRLVLNSLQRVAGPVDL